MDETVLMLRERGGEAYEFSHDARVVPETYALAAANRIESLETLVDEMAKVLGSITEAYETNDIHNLLYRVSITR